MIKKVLFSIPDKLLDEMTKIAEEESRTRSELVREALRYYMKKGGYGLKKDTPVE